MDEVSDMSLGPCLDFFPAQHMAGTGKQRLCLQCGHYGDGKRGELNWETAKPGVEVVCMCIPTPWSRQYKGYCVSHFLSLKVFMRERFIRLTVLLGSVHGQLALRQVGTYSGRP